MSEFIIALHALVCLAHDGCSKSSEELSANLCTNPVRIRKVMSKCKKIGLVKTKAGVNGGYIISKSGKEITLRDIYDAVNIPLIDTRWHSGDISSECIIASGMGEYVTELFSLLNDKVLVVLGEITLEDVEHRLMSIKERKQLEICK
ncbi:RrF2 family transcriptional regulator [Peptostreptococcus porci]|uniref:RrF2 family transcriptional regulator n=1 Tax=Peptostreptococcus porci TaxID=2652282 RepID=UPI0023F2A54F|nr:Rrf2 family transcriptional regulator [Peptostreptococcus porci]MDD7182921.1 Rrf2 family transcriptional regulator [Peptostreptococcus porci]MDY5963984.1 Rrf2 family transcriptional regulator [Peptostreptococcus porci]